MQTKTAVIAFISIAMSILTSCIDNDRRLGNNILPPDQILTVQTKVFNIDIKNKVSDSVQSVSYSHLLVGELHHPVFGTVTSGGASYIMPYSDTADFGIDPQLKNAYLNLTVNSIYCTDASQEGIHQRFRIHELLQPIDSSFSCNTDMTPDKFSSETISEIDPVIYGKGTVKIPLKKSFAEKLMATTPEEFKDMDLFLKRIHGLYITIDPTIDNNGKSGRMNFLNLGSSKITLEYTMNDPKRNIENVDTTESFAFAYSYAFNYFKTGSAHLENDNPGNSLYVESLSGIKPYIEAKALKEMLDNWVKEDTLTNRTIILSRAELILPFEMPENHEIIDNEFPQTLYAFKNGRTGTGSDTTVLYYQPLDEVYHHSNVGGINRSLKTYSMDITDYVQDLLLNDLEDIDSHLDLWIAPMYARTSYTSGRYYFDNRSYNMAVLNGPDSERKPTLRLTFGVMQN